MEQVLKKFDLAFFASGQHKITPETFLQSSNGMLLDVRSPEEVETITVKLAHHSTVTVLPIPIREVPERLHEIPNGRPIAVFCSSDTRAAITYAFLLSRGYTDVRLLEGGYTSLTDALKPGKLVKTIKASA